jgi:hypothetical protein
MQNYYLYLRKNGKKENKLQEDIYIYIYIYTKNDKLTCLSQAL